MSRAAHLSPFCYRCHVNNLPLFTPTLLRGVWQPVPAADVARHAYCEQCAWVVISTKGA